MGTMDSRERPGRTPGGFQPPFPERMMATVRSPVEFLDSARERPLPRSSVQLNSPRDAVATPAIEFVSSTNGQRTESRFLFSDGEGASYEPDMRYLGNVNKEVYVDEETDHKDDAMRVHALMARLKGIQEKLDTQETPPEDFRSFAPDVHSDHHSYPLDSHRVSISDVVPERFHAGRESLSVRRNITVRESKRPKERTLDREYKQRFSLTPGKVLGGPSVGFTQGGAVTNQRSVAPQGERFTDHGQQSSGGNPSSPAGDTMRYVSKTSPSVPSPQNEYRFDARQDNGECPYGDVHITITLIHEGNRIRHQIWPTMPVAVLTQDAATLFRLPPPASAIVLMLFGMIPSVLHFDQRICDPPQVTNGATVLVFQVPVPSADIQPSRGMPQVPIGGANPGAYFGGQLVQNLVPPLPQNPKFLGNFKLDKFDGTARHWKAWNKSFTRYLAIHQLDYVIEPEFLDLLPHSQDAFTANKMVYYILESAIIAGSLATKYFRLAAKWNGHQAYYCLHDGYVLSGPQTASLLLSELANLRFKSNETASGFCLRLRELFEDLEMVPGNASVKMHDTQKIGYLLTAIRQEKSLDSVYVAIQTGQRRGDITFEDACDDLHHRCEAIEADELLYTQVKDSGRKVLITTQGKRQNKDIPEAAKKPCLEKGCSEMVKPYLPLCPLHYHQCVSGKTPSLELKNGLGSASYDSSKHAMVYPSTVPKDRLPIPKGELKPIKRKGLVGYFRSTNALTKTDGSVA